MAKPVKSLELHYPMIQFLINLIMPLYLDNPVVNWLLVEESVS